MIYLWDSAMLPCYYVPEVKVKNRWGDNCYVSIFYCIKNKETGILTFGFLVPKTISKKHADYNVVKNAIEDFRNNPFFEIDLRKYIIENNLEIIK